jgi:hypothetical protein
MTEDQGRWPGDVTPKLAEKTVGWIDTSSFKPD